MMQSYYFFGNFASKTKKVMKKFGCFKKKQYLCIAFEKEGVWQCLFRKGRLGEWLKPPVC